MGDDLKQNLANYKAQLQQVEAALTTDPENDDLLKLKNDLQEVIVLTQELVANQDAAPAPPASDDGPSTSTSTEAVPAARPQKSVYSAALPARAWKIGDKCLAVYSDDQTYYEATIDEILDDGTCTVTFDGYGNTDITQLSSLKSCDSHGDGPDAKRPKTKRDKIAEEREYKRKKNQKKAQRRKELEEERESEKNKWLDFNAKAFSKTSKGKVKKSIFASPDSVGGRVGVGTCGVSGKPMTQFSGMEKWKK